MLDQFVEALDRLEIRRTDLEVAEILWLAALWPDSRQEAPASEVPVPSGSVTCSAVPEHSASQDESLPASAPGPPVQRKPVESEEIDVAVPLPGAREHSSGQGELVGATGDRALHGSNAISKALRPLSRRYASRRRTHVDEDATADRIAQEKIWIPVEAETPTRWLDLAIVVDGSPSMQVWSRTVQELESLLKVQGAFDRVRTWRLRSEIGGDIVLTGARGTGRHRPRELRDPAGRVLVLIVSDCVGDIWYRPALVDAIRAWGETQPVAILQMLPPWLWKSTALGTSPIALASAGERAANNRRLAARPLSPLVTIAQGDIIVPTLTLDSERVRSWARLLAGIGDARTGAVFLRHGRRIDELEPTSEERLARFLANASPTAVRLAAILAATPLQLPIIRAVQRATMPDSTQTHLAEILVGGLIRRDPLDRTDDLERAYYEFHGDIADRLLAAIPAPDVLDVARRVQAFLEDRASEYGELLSFLAGNPESNVLGDSVAARHFTTVKRRILRRVPSLKGVTDVRTANISDSAREKELLVLAAWAEKRFLPTSPLVPGRYALILGDGPERRLLNPTFTALGLDVLDLGADEPPTGIAELLRRLVGTWIIIVIGEAARSSGKTSERAGAWRTCIASALTALSSQPLAIFFDGDLPEFEVSRVLSSPSSVGRLVIARTANQWFRPVELFKHLLEESTGAVDLGSLYPRTHDPALLPYQSESEDEVISAGRASFVRARWAEDRVENTRILWACEGASDSDIGYLRGSGAEVDVVIPSGSANALRVGDYSVVVIDDFSHMKDGAFRELCRGKQVLRFHGESLKEEF